MKKHGKKYEAVAKLIDKNKSYTIDEAIPILQKTKYTNFNPSCELHMNLNVDTKHADQIVRGTVELPHGTGKSVKVWVVVPEDLKNNYKNLKVEKIGNDDIIADIKKEKFDFDILVAHPKMMKELAQVAKVLGPKGLMPNPKSGTVTEDIEGIVEKLSKGLVEFRTDKNGNIHCFFGKCDFDENKLKENLETLIKEILKAKPSGVKGQYVKTISISLSQGPSMFISYELNK